MNHNAQINLLPTTHTRVHLQTEACMVVDYFLALAHRAATLHTVHLARALETQSMALALVHRREEWRIPDQARDPRREI